MRAAQFLGHETLQALDVEEAGISWLIPSVSYVLPDVESFGVRGYP